jgi:hypothetical protein
VRTEGDVTEREHGVPLGPGAARARLTWAAEEAKKRLSFEPYARVREEALVVSGGRSLHLDREVTREEYEELIHPLVESTFASVTKALEAAGLRLLREGADGPPAPPGFALLEGPGGERVERVDLVDEKLHESGRPLLELLGEIELHARGRLGPLLEAAPRRCLLALFSDHGFRQRDRPARHGPRYSHGGATPQEVITPVGLLYRA